jgi:pteridine reductase
MLPGARPFKPGAGRRSRAVFLDLAPASCILAPVPTTLITGAGVRLGRAIAQAFLDAGWDLALHVNRSREPADALAAEARAAGRTAQVFVADLSTEAGQQALARDVTAAFPVLDAVVHNAGLFEKTPFAAVDRAAWRRMQAVNLEAPFFVTQALLPALRAAPAPAVVHLTDIAGERPIAGYSHYSASKAGLVMLTRALAAELAPHVRVNAVSPGTVVFPADFDEATRARFLARIPLHREGTAEDVARAVLFLVRDAPYVTGQVLAVDGGRSCVL